MSLRKMSSVSWFLVECSGTSYTEGILFKRQCWDKPSTYLPVTKVMKNSCSPGAKTAKVKFFWTFFFRITTFTWNLKHAFFNKNVMYQTIALTVSNPFLLYWIPDKRPSNVDILPPRWQASQEGTAKSSSTSWKSGYFSRLLVNAGFQTEEETKESLSPDSFLRVTCNGTEKYSSSEEGA